MIMKNVLVITTSNRNHSNSTALAAEFVRGAKEAGNKVTEISLKGKHIRFCLGCCICWKTHRCVIRDDDMARIVEAVKNADVLVFATPIYYYEMSGQLKTTLDRLNPLYTDEYNFRDVYCLTTAESADPTTPEHAVNGIKGWVRCFPNARFVDSVFAGGILNAGAIVGHPALKTAYEMGRSI